MSTKIFVIFTKSFVIRRGGRKTVDVNELRAYTDDNDKLAGDVVFILIVR